MFTPGVFMDMMEKDIQERNERRKKNSAEATRIKDLGNEQFKEGNYEKAVELYSQVTNKTCRLVVIVETIQDCYSLYRKMPCHQIFRNLKTLRYRLRVVQLLWNLTCVSAAVLLRHVNFESNMKILTNNLVIFLALKFGGKIYYNLMIIMPGL